MTRTTNEQREQVDRYVEIIRGQQDLAATRTQFVKITALGASTGFLISLLSLALAFLDHENFRFSIWIVVALFGSLLGPLTTGLLGFLWLGVRNQRVAERLSSLEHDDDPKILDDLRVERLGDDHRASEGQRSAS